MMMRWLAAVLLFCSPGLGLAHSLSVAYVDLAAGKGEGEVSIQLDLALRDIALTLPLDANRDDKVTWGELLAMEPALQTLAADGLRLQSAAGRCTARPAGFRTTRGHQSQGSRCDT